MPRTPKRDAAAAVATSSRNDANTTAGADAPGASTPTSAGKRDADTSSRNGMADSTLTQGATDAGRGSVVFFHPDLGIGGAERLIVDAAVGLQECGRRVVIFTSHCDPSHCFEEAKDGTLDVRVRGNLLPATLGGRFKILLTILRHYHLLLTIAFTGELRALRPEAFVADQLSAGLPLLRFLYADVRILFYCHFPDLLLVQRRSSWIKRIWRVPFDALEEWSMRGADRIVVNSEFTKSVVNGVWSGMGGEHGLGVVYPCVDTTQGTREAIRGFPRLWGGKKVILSINRFERKKDVGLAIRAFAKLSRRVREGAKLIIAGGYDERERENVAYHKELVALCDELELSSATAKTLMAAGGDASVLFLLSVPAQLKDMLLKTATLLLYTPAREHFGIVPLEAMLAGVPVLATNSGGPLETVADGVTGWQRDPADTDAWAAVVEMVLAELPDAELERMGVAGRTRVVQRFSKTTMAHTLDEEIRLMQRRARAHNVELRDIFLTLGMMGAVGLGVIAMLGTPLWKIK